MLPEAQQLQRLKVELYLAAAHQPGIDEALGRVLARHTADLQARLEAAGLSAEEAVLAPSGGRAIDHGIALVDVDGRARSTTSTGASTSRPLISRNV